MSMRSGGWVRGRSRVVYLPRHRVEEVLGALRPAPAPAKLQWWAQRGLPLDLMGGCRLYRLPRAGP